MKNYLSKIIKVLYKKCYKIYPLLFRSWLTFGFSTILKIIFILVFSGIYTPRIVTFLFELLMKMVDQSSWSVAMIIVFIFLSFFAKSVLEEYFYNKRDK